jgi:hypothetical protein
MQQVSRRIVATPIQLSNTPGGCLPGLWGGEGTGEPRRGAFNGPAPRWNNEAREIARLMVPMAGMSRRYRVRLFLGGHHFPLAIAMAHLLRRMNLHSVLAWRTTTSCP